MIAMMNYDAPGEGSSFLSFRKGDLIHLGDNEQGEDVMNSGWCFGQSEKTSAKGDFPAECVYILPTITKPSHEVITLFASRSSEETDRILATTNSALDYSKNESADDMSSPPYTLESYALDHFLPPPKRTLSKALAKGNPLLSRYAHLFTYCIRGSEEERRTALELPERSDKDTSPQEARAFL